VDELDVLQDNLLPVSDKTPDDIDQRVAPHLEYFAERSNLLFSYHFFSIEFQDDEDLEFEAGDNSRTWRIRTIHNACLNTSLIALRDLDDFFALRNSNTKADDLRASDFGLSHSMRFLADDERKWINKLIAHTTQHGATQRFYRWDLVELISKAVAQCDSFLEWIKQNYSVSHFNTWTAAAGTQSITKAFMKSMLEEMKRHRNEEAEQAGARQPATRSESKSDGDENPNPEAEGRSQ